MGFLGPSVSVRFSSKILGLNARIFRTISGSSGLNFQNFIRSYVLFLCVIAGKMNNMLVV